MSRRKQSDVPRPGQDLHIAGRGLRSSSLLFALPQVWEDAAALRPRGEHRGRRVVQQHHFAVTDGREISARAVVVLDDDGRVERLLDAKREHLDSSPSAPDIDQMVTYSHRLGLWRGARVHPVSEGATTFSAVSLGGVDVGTISPPVTALGHRALPGSAATRR